MTTKLPQITAAVAEAQAVLGLVHDKLAAHEPLTAEQTFQLRNAMTLALTRLDHVHDYVIATIDANPALEL